MARNGTAVYPPLTLITTSRRNGRSYDPTVHGEQLVATNRVQCGQQTAVSPTL